MDKSLAADLILLVAATLFVASPAAAYIDPSTSGFVMQLAAPILLAAGVMRNRIRLIIATALARVFRRNVPPEE